MIAQHYFNGHTIWLDTYANVWCVKPGYCTHCCGATATYPTREAAHAAIA